MDGPAECTEQQKMLGEFTEALGDAEISYSNLKLAIQESECADKYMKQVYLEKCQAEDRVLVIQNAIIQGQPSAATGIKLGELHLAWASYISQRGEGEQPDASSQHACSKLFRGYVLLGELHLATGSKPDADTALVIQNAIIQLRAQPDVRLDVRSQLEENFFKCVRKRKADL